jgi:hypothetical protein
MDLEKFIRPDGSTYWALAPADPKDKPFVEQLPGVDVFPKRKICAAAYCSSGRVWLFSIK